MTEQARYNEPESAQISATVHYLYSQPEGAPQAGGTLSVTQAASGITSVGVAGWVPSSDAAPQPLIKESVMDDKDVQRLDEKIAASEERSQLRLEKMMERVDGALARFTDQATAIRQDLQELRSDGRALRAEVAQVVTGVRTELSAQLDKHRATEQTHFHWTIGTIVAVGLGVCAILLALGQVWGSAAQFAQSVEREVQEAIHSTSAPQPALPPLRPPPATKP